MTPLYIAIRFNNIDIIKLLVSQPNIDINYTDISNLFR